MKRPVTPRTSIVESELLSSKLAHVLSSKKKLYITDLENIFQEKSFAIALLLLMSLPALPIPTGGITHVFEIASMLLALELLAGRRTIWLPHKMRKLGISKELKTKAIPFIIRRVVFLEKHSRPRAAYLFKTSWFRRILGLPILVLVVLAFLAPPFSGLDTLFAMGVVAIALAMLLEDVALLVVAVVLGVLGVVAEVFFGSLLVHFFKNLFR